jgi:hypothetical protein
MRPNLLLLAVIAMVVGSAYYLIESSTNPEEVIIGHWEEVSWEYEKPIISDNGYSEDKAIADNIRKELVQDMVIHKAETWHFYPNGILILEGEDKFPTFLDWKMKGRGHILKLHYEDEIKEYYNIIELNREELILHFHVEMQAKGIARITFRRKDTDAQ